MPFGTGLIDTYTFCLIVYTNGDAIARACDKLGRDFVGHDLKGY